MIAVKIDNKQFQCNRDTAINETQLNHILRLSLTSITSDPSAEKILDTVESTQVLGFDLKVVLAASDESRAGFARSTPDECSGKYDALHDPLLVGYFGFKSDQNSDPNDYKSLAINTLKDTLLADPLVSNEELAQKIIAALRGTPNNDFDWITAVFPYGSYDADMFSMFFQSNSSNDWNSNTLYVENIIGKNLLVSGIAGIQDQFNKCTRPVDPQIFEPFVSYAVSSHLNNSTLILETIKKGAKLLGFEAEVILVASGVPEFANEPFTYADCTYKYRYATLLGRAAVLFYGLPLL